MTPAQRLCRETVLGIRRLASHSSGSPSPLLLSYLFLLEYYSSCLDWAMRVGESEVLFSDTYSSMCSPSHSILRFQIH